MRRVTFSTPEIQNAIREHFVAMNTNIEGDPTAGESIRHRPSDQPGSCIRGNGRQNVQTLFLTPDLKIFHVASGFQSPGDLYDEMQFAARLFAEMGKEKALPADTVRNAHLARLQDAGFPDSQIHATNDVELMRSMMSGKGSLSIDPSSMLNGGSPSVDGNDMFSAMVRREFLKDQQFSMKHPLLSLNQLEADPGELVGRGKSFFSSSSNSSGNPGFGR